MTAGEPFAEGEEYRVIYRTDSGPEWVEIVGTAHVSPLTETWVISGTRQDAGCILPLRYTAEWSAAPTGRGTV